MRQAGKAIKGIQNMRSWKVNLTFTVTVTGTDVLVALQEAKEDILAGNGEVTGLNATETAPPRVPPGGEPGASY